MLKLESDTLYAGVSELRTSAPRLLEESKKNRVILMKRNLPVAAIINYADYQRFEDMMEILEDLVLGYEAKQRASRKKKRFISMEEAEKLVGLR